MPATSSYTPWCIRRLIRRVQRIVANDCCHDNLTSLARKATANQGGREGGKTRGEGDGGRSRRRAGEKAGDRGDVRMCARWRKPILNVPLAHLTDCPG
eukprot:6174951-Pleurochrysis_carterae.AAC.2